MYSPYYIFTIFLLYFCESTAKLGSTPEVLTPLGRVQGQWKTSYDGRQYASFEGIPYAIPPVGALRFEEPLPVEPWIGTWNATQSYECVQISFDFNTITGTEDCLYINVFVPLVDENQLDVVVHIHGGAFMVGHGLAYLNPKNVMDRNIILVTFNYRLGPLGFSSTDDEILPGNIGLKDQVLALKWIQQNIASFGGNPDSVTLTGFSAGAASSHLHYFSPLSKGLFHRGMSLSGTALNSWSIVEKPAENIKKLATLVGCPASDSKTLVECLKTRPEVLLLKKLKYIYDFPPAPLTIFGPVVEKKSKNPFLSQRPLTILKQKKTLNVPWITSVARDEGIVLGPLFLEPFQQLNERWDEIAPVVLHREQLLGKKSLLNEIKKFYVGENGEFTMKNFGVFTKMLTDSLFPTDSETAAKLQSKATEAPVYYYFFNYDKGENTLANLFPSDLKTPGVSHGDDMIYFFGGAITKKLSESDEKLRNICLDILYNYAKDGVPSFEGVEWKPTGSEELTFLNITGPEDIKQQVTSDLSPSGKFWRQLEPTEDAKDEL